MPSHFQGIKFSVLISVYDQERPAYFDAALSSIENQTLLPSEIIIVKDGPLTSELDSVITQYRSQSEIQYKIINIKGRVGLGKALNVGIKYCSHEWIARMDTDDIAMPERFEKQIRYISSNPKVSVLGGWICEFVSDPWRCDMERRVPTRHRKIYSFAKYRNPINHMTVIFRKSAVTSVGGYLPLGGFEDYYLWVRMLQYRFMFANIDEVLVRARVGNDMISRRRGWRYLKHEWLFLKSANKEGFLSRYEMYRNMAMRTIPRIIPSSLLQKIYDRLRKVDRKN